MKTIDMFSEFLIVHNKSLWDPDFEDLKKYLLETDNKQSRSIISTFYRVLIDSGEFKRENPVIQLNRIEREDQKKALLTAQPIGRAASVIQELDDTTELEEIKVHKPVKKKKLGKRIMILGDLDQLVQKASHIRDRAILEFLYATGTQIQEIVNLNVADVDLEARQVTIQQGEDHFRTLIMPKRTVNFLKIYERWRRRQLSPSQAYYITKTTRKRMSDTSISTWLARIQRDKQERERWTTMDFRKRALLQHYWVTRDLIAVARFGGYKRPESALNLISEILNDQGVDSIDALASLPEFEALKSDGKRLAAIGSDDQLTITIQLDRDEMDIIRNSGLTPTQAVKTIISLKDLYGAFSPGGAPVGGGGAQPAGGTTPVKPGKISAPVAAKPGEAPKISLPQPGGPAKGPSLGGGGPSLDASGGPTLGGAPSGGPSLSGPSGPALDKESEGILDVKLSSAPKEKKEPPKQPPPGGGGGPMDQIGELKAILAARRAKADGVEDPDKDKMTERPTLGGKIMDSDGTPSKSDDDKTKDDDDDDDDEEEGVPDLPDFDF